MVKDIREISDTSHVKSTTALVYCSTLSVSQPVEDVMTSDWLQREQGCGVIEIIFSGPDEADIRLHHPSPTSHLTSSIPWPGLATLPGADCPGHCPDLITGAAWQARAPLASQSRSVKMSQNMASWYTFFSHFPFTLIPPFTQHVILLRKHLFSPLPPMPLLLAFLSFSLRLSEFSAWWRSSELTAGAAHPGLTRNGQWLGKCIRASTKKPNVEKCSKAAQTSGACDLFYLCGRYSVVLSTQAIT